MTDVRPSISNSFFESQIQRNSVRNSSHRKSGMSNRTGEDKNSRKSGRKESITEWRRKNLTPISEDKGTTMNRYTKAPKKEGVSRYFKGVIIDKDGEVIKKPTWKGRKHQSKTSGSTIEGRNSKIELTSHFINIDEVDGSEKSPLKSPHFKMSKIEQREKPLDTLKPMFDRKSILKVPSSEFNIYEEDSHENETQQDTISKASISNKRSHLKIVKSSYDAAGSVSQVREGYRSNQEEFFDGRKPSIFNVSPLLFGSADKKNTAPKSVHDVSDRPSIFNVSPMLFSGADKQNSRISKTPREVSRTSIAPDRPSLFNVSPLIFSSNEKENRKKKEIKRSKSPNPAPRKTYLTTIGDHDFEKKSKPKVTSIKIEKKTVTSSYRKPSIFNVSPMLFGAKGPHSSSSSSSSYSKSSSKRETEMRYTKQPVERSPVARVSLKKLDTIIDEEDEDEDSFNRKAGIYTPKTKKGANKARMSTAAKTIERRLTTAPPYKKKMSFGRHEGLRMSVL